MNAKYEYLLHVWGGFWNDGNVKIHGEQYVPYKWFDTVEERKKEIDRLDCLCKSLGTWDASIARNLTEGFLMRYEFVLQTIINDNSSIIVHENNLGYGFFSDRDIDQYEQFFKENKWDVGFDGSDNAVPLFTTLILRK